MNHKHLIAYYNVVVVDQTVHRPAIILWPTRTTSLTTSGLDADLDDSDTEKLDDQMVELLESSYRGNLREFSKSGVRV